MSWLRFDIGTFIFAKILQFNYKSHQFREKKNIDDLRLFCYFYFIHQSFNWPLNTKSFGNDFNGYDFNSLAELMPDNNKDLDIIFDEIDALVEDFRMNY